jgi:hypothetical protein
MISADRDAGNGTRHDLDPLLKSIVRPKRGIPIESEPNRHIELGENPSELLMSDRGEA